MKVYAAAWWDNYYPMPDNVGGVFSNDRDAYIFLDKKDKNTERSYRSMIVTEFLSTKWRTC